MLTQLSEGKLCFYGHCGNSHRALAGALQSPAPNPSRRRFAAPRHPRHLWLSATFLSFPQTFVAQVPCGMVRSARRKWTHTATPPPLLPPASTPSAVWKLCLSPSQTEPNASGGLPSHPLLFLLLLLLLFLPIYETSRSAAAQSRRSPSGPAGGPTAAATPLHTLHYADPINAGSFLRS